MFKPQGRQRRTAQITVPQASGGTATRSVVVLQGHSGAVYAPIEGTSRAASVKPQTLGQNYWHNDLRAHFDATASITESRAAVRAVMQRVVYFIADTVWEGSNPGQFAGFDEYFDSGGSPEPFSDITTRAAGAYNLIDADFERALEYVP